MSSDRDPTHNFFDIVDDVPINYLSRARRSNFNDVKQKKMWPRDREIVLMLLY